MTVTRHLIAGTVMFCVAGIGANVVDILYEPDVTSPPYTASYSVEFLDPCADGYLVPGFIPPPDPGNFFFRFWTNGPGGESPKQRETEMSCECNPDLCEGCDTDIYRTEP